MVFVDSFNFLDIIGMGFVNFSVGRSLALMVGPAAYRSANNGFEWQIERRKAYVFLVEEQNSRNLEFIQPKPKVQPISECPEHFMFIQG